MPRIPGHRRDAARRAQLAELAARVMVEQGVRDFALAKRKAADRLHLDANATLPSNAEIDQAVRRYQALYYRDQQPKQLYRLRSTAVAAMQWLAPFQPRLVGAVLDGSADQHSAVCLHLFVDDPVAVERFLIERGIAYASGSRRLRFEPQCDREVVKLGFSADEIAFDLTVLPQDGLRQAPLNRVDGQPMRRATRAAVVALLEQCADSTCE